MFKIHGVMNLVPAAEIRDHETGLVSGQFSWFQYRQLFLETHETEVVYMSSRSWLLALGSRDLKKKMFA